jgi:rhodanese-related sulfurtransferase
VSDEQQVNAEVSPAEAAEMVAAGAVIVDVRRPYEYEGGRIVGSRNIEMNELAAHAEELPRDQPVVLYCRSGNRSGMAVAALREAGFDAHNIAGGLEAWSAEGRPLEPEGGEVRPPLPAS